MHLPKINLKAEEKKIVSFIADTFKKANKHSAIVAVSGGVDSATSLLLAVKALGPENVLALHMPSKSSDPKHARDIKSLLGAVKLPVENFITINIGSIIQKTWKIIKHYAGKEVRPLSEVGPLKTANKGTPDRTKINAEIARLNKLRLANMAARVRMVVLYDQAKLENALVVGTENYSEQMLGYFTRFGDEASDIEPIRHLYKTQVYELAKHLGVPKEIVVKEPSADLWRGQTDEGELGFSYAQADPILAMFAQGKSSEDMIKAGCDKKLVEAVLNQVRANNFKHKVPHKV